MAKLNTNTLITPRPLFRCFTLYLKMPLQADVKPETKKENQQSDANPKPDMQ
jgi:hypothetical protein